MTKKMQAGRVKRVGALLIRRLLSVDQPLIRWASPLAGDPQLPGNRLDQRLWLSSPVSCVA